MKCTPNRLLAWCLLPFLLAPAVLARPPRSSVPNATSQPSSYGVGPEHGRRLPWPVPTDRPPEPGAPIGRADDVLVITDSGLLHTPIRPRRELPWVPWPGTPNRSGAPLRLVTPTPLRLVHAAWGFEGWLLWLIDPRRHVHFLRQQGSAWRRTPMPLDTPDDPRHLARIIVLPDGRVLLGWHSGLLQWFEEGEHIESKRLERPLQQLFVSEQDGLLIASLWNGTLIALSAEGTERWRHRAPTPFASISALGGGRLWGYTEAGQLFALRVQDGVLLRIVSIPQPPRSLLDPRHVGPSLGFPSTRRFPLLVVLSQGKLLAIASDGSARFTWPAFGLAAIDPEQGVRWRLPPQEDRPPFTSLLVDTEGRTLALDFEGTLSLFDTDGTLLWQRPMAGLRLSNHRAPALFGGPRGRLVVLGGDGWIVPLHFTASR